ncbi:MAG: Hpt domain-containing protein [Nitrosopumilaceae archaeon]
MSDNFLKLARKEIQEELDSLNQILSRCNSDPDISTNGKEIERHLHKIKGLAPMMDQKDVGDIAALIDTIAKHIIANGTVAGTYNIFSESIKIMSDIFSGAKMNAEEFKNKIKQTFSNVLKR